MHCLRITAGLTECSKRKPSVVLKAVLSCKRLVCRRYMPPESLPMATPPRARAQARPHSASDACAPSAAPLTFTLTMKACLAQSAADAPSFAQLCTLLEDISTEIQAPQYVDSDGNMRARLWPLWNASLKLESVFSWQCHIARVFCVCSCLNPMIIALPGGCQVYGSGRTHGRSVDEYQYLLCSLIQLCRERPLSSTTGHIALALQVCAHATST
jgi:hypothetical protein